MELNQEKQARVLLHLVSAELVIRVPGRRKRAHLQVCRGAISDERVMSTAQCGGI